MSRSHGDPADLVPVPAGALHLVLKLRVTEGQRRALAARLELGRKMAGPRDCKIALEGVLERYLEQLDREAFEGDLLDAVRRLEDGG